MSCVHRRMSGGACTSGNQGSTVPKCTLHQASAFAQQNPLTWDGGSTGLLQIQGVRRQDARKPGPLSAPVWSLQPEADSANLRASWPAAQRTRSGRRGLRLYRSWREREPLPFACLLHILPTLASGALWVSVPCWGQVNTSLCSAARGGKPCPAASWPHICRPQGHISLLLSSQPCG